MWLYIAIHFVLVSGMEFLLWAMDSTITFGAHFYFTCVGSPIFARTHHSVDQETGAKIKGAVIAQCTQLRYQSNMRCQMNSVTMIRAQWKLVILLQPQLTVHQIY